MKVNGQKIYHVNIENKKGEVATLTSDKTNCMTVSINKAKEGYFIMMKAPVHQEDITIINNVCNTALTELVIASKRRHQELTDLRGPQSW